MDIKLVEKKMQKLTKHDKKWWNTNWTEKKQSWFTKTEIKSDFFPIPFLFSELDILRCHASASLLQWRDVYEGSASHPVDSWDRQRPGGLAGMDVWLRWYVILKSYICCTCLYWLIKHDLNFYVHTTLTYIYIYRYVDITCRLLFFRVAAASLILY